MVSNKHIVTGDDGWATVKPKRNQKHSAAYLAHRTETSTLSSSSSSSSSSIPISSIPYETLTNKFDKIHETFTQSTCVSSVKQVIKQAIDSFPPSSNTSHYYCLCLALGSLSECNARVSPLYQFSALLVVLETLGATTIPTDIYDPCFTDVDLRFLESRYGMKYLTPKELDVKFPAGFKADGMVLYLPHGPVELSYKYMLLRPSIYIGNSWEHYRVLLTEHENKTVFPEIDRFLEEYECVEFPEANKYRDGTLFNHLAIYWKKPRV